MVLGLFLFLQLGVNIEVGAAAALQEVDSLSELQSLQSHFEVWNGVYHLGNCLGRRGREGVQEDLTPICVVVLEVVFEYVQSLGSSWLEQLSVPRDDPDSC